MGNQPGQMCRALIQFGTRQEPLGPRLFTAHHEGALPNHRLSQRLGRKDEKGYGSRGRLNEEALIMVCHEPTPFLSSAFGPSACFVYHICPTHHTTDNLISQIA